MRRLCAATLVLPVLLLGGCAEIGYYVQSIDGQLGLLASREPLAELIDDPVTPPPLRERLVLARDVREFASADLGLPRDGSYGSYVQLDRPYVVWTVVAAPELALEPRTWCFPVAGCVAYRGYFRREEAERYAAELRAAGDDVWVGGVSAYSTLGWFEDPLLSSMLGGPVHDLAGVIFHELAHRQLYVPDDTDFNEAFAVTVERAGVQRWLAGHGDEVSRRRYREALRRNDAIVALALQGRAALAAVYAADEPEEVKRSRKRVALVRLRQAYDELVRRDPAMAGAEAFFGAGLNNARLASIATYHRLVPAFERLLAARRGDLQAFYADVAALAELPEEQRRMRLSALLEAG